MRRFTLGLCWLALGFLLLAVFSRPLARAVWTDYAVWEGCPLTGDDVRLLRPMPDGNYAAGSLHVAAEDPWGQPYRFHEEGLGLIVYSSGPNGVDDGGPGAGDDLAVLSDKTYTFVAEIPLYGGLATLLFGWLALVVHVWAKPRSERVGVEAGRAAFLALLPAALGTWLVFRSPDPLEALEPLAPGLLLPLPAAVSAGVAFALYLAALRLRLSRPAAEFQGDPPARRRRVGLILGVGLGAVTVCALLTGWGLARYDAWQRDRLLARAQVGLPSAIRAVLISGDSELVLGFVLHAPNGFDFGSLSEGPLGKVAELGPEAMPAMLTTLHNPPGTTGLRTLGVDYMRQHDPQLRTLAAEIERDPEGYAGALHFFADELLPLWGRRATIEHLLPRLEDRRPIKISWSGYQPRVCDEALSKILGLIGPGAPVQAPSLIGNTPRAVDYDAAISELRAWWQTGPALTPQCWIRLEVVGLPASEGQPLSLEVRYDLGAAGYFGTSQRVEQPTHVLIQQLASQAVVLVLRGDDQERLRVPVDPLVKDCTVEVRVDWKTGAHETRITEHPG